MNSTSLALLLVVGSVAGGFGQSPPPAAQHPWIWRNGSPHGGGIHSLAASPSQVLALDSGGQMISLSSDGVSFRNVKHDSGGEIFSGPVAWHQGLWVALKYNGILTSPDAVTWTLRHAAPESCAAVASNGAEVLVSGGRGMILRSTDGISWGSVASNTNIYLDTLTWTGNEWLVGGSTGSVLQPSAASRSSNGQVWTAMTLPPEMGALVSMAGQNGKAVATCRLGSYEPLWSSRSFWAWSGVVADGAAAWTKASGDGTANRLYAAGNGRWLGVAAYSDWGQPGGAVVFSETGALWTLAGTAAMHSAVAFNGRLLVAGDMGISTVTLSPFSVTPLARPITAHLNCVVWTGRRFVAAGREPGEAMGTVVVSDDGISWQNATDSITFGDSDVREMIWTGSRIVAVGYYDGSPMAWQSPDGLTWQEMPVPAESGPLEGVAWNGQTTAIVTAHGQVVYSRIVPGVGEVFDQYANIDDDRTSDIEWNGSLWIVSGRNAVHTSPDLAHWTPRSPDSGYGTANAQRVLVVGNQATVPLFTGAGIITGTDPEPYWHNLENFTGLASNGSVKAFATGAPWRWVGDPVEASNEYLFYDYNSGLLGFDPNEPQSGQLVSQGLNDLVWGNGKFVAVGQNGAILTSGEPAAPRVTFAAGQVRLQWERFSNYDEYLVEGSSDLANWQPLAPPVIDAEELTLPESAMGRRQFLRVIGK